MGKKRSSNEDALAWGRSIAQEATLVTALGLQSLSQNPLFLIADGMGGHGNGALAAKLALTTFIESVRPPYTKWHLYDVLRTVNDRLFTKMDEEPSLRTMGTTIVGVGITDLTCSFFNIGDSRAYLLRDRSLIQLTSDDVPDNGTSGKRASHTLTQALGGLVEPREIFPHLGEVILESGDRLILCSDGVTDMITDAALERICLNSPLQDVCTNVFAAAMEAGGHDNISLIVADVPTQ